jgi:hypothetical protein
MVLVLTWGDESQKSLRSPPHNLWGAVGWVERISTGVLASAHPDTFAVCHTPSGETYQGLSIPGLGIPLGEHPIMGLWVSTG